MAGAVLSDAHTPASAPSVRDMSTIWQRFNALPGHQRVLLGIAGMVLSSLGLYFGEKAQKADPPHKIAADSADSLRGALKGRGGPS